MLDSSFPMTLNFAILHAPHEVSVHGLDPHHHRPSDSREQGPGGEGEDLRGRERRPPLVAVAPVRAPQGTRRRAPGEGQVAAEARRRAPGRRVVVEDVVEVVRRRVHGHAGPPGPPGPPHRVRPDEHHELRRREALGPERRHLLLRRVVAPQQLLLRAGRARVRPSRLEGEGRPPRCLHRERWARELACAWKPPMSPSGGGGLG